MRAVEFASITREGDQVKFSIFDAKRVDELLAAANLELQAAAAKDEE